ncbi:MULTISPECIES: hypothetical protein [unclassified Streptomyces]|uniref:hypothetical protein n=1 Tax=unclassified Streptomyces TaxID=2593676 RepID=UPI00093B34B7|nr:hypothetical protein [Streptomyces sp. CB02058]OKI97941.1 hypothetical protein AMK10_03785 [Streptomyces sp. CB02058]
MTASYTFLTVHRPAPHLMAPALAGALGVPATDVDVADEDGQADDRNWDAPVLCSYHSVAGDVALAWDVSASDAVAAPPGEEEAAQRLAGVLGTTVLYPAREKAPSAYWAVGPDGTPTRARLLEGDEDPPVLVVDAVEAPMDQLPGARVEVLAEILREQHVETPVTDAYAAASDPHGRAPATGNVNRAREALLLWERLVRRIEAGWSPGGHYTAELYVEDLRTRDRLEELAGIAGPEREPVGRAVAELDEVFRQGTESDDGALLGRLTRSGSAVADRGWWWHRRPVRLPWDD